MNRQELICIMSAQILSGMLGAGNYQFLDPETSAVEKATILYENIYGLTDSEEDEPVK